MNVVVGCCWSNIFISILPIVYRLFSFFYLWTSIHSRISLEIFTKTQYGTFNLIYLHWYKPTNPQHILHRSLCDGQAINHMWNRYIMFVFIGWHCGVQWLCGNLYLHSSMIIWAQSSSPHNSLRHWTDEKFSIKLIRIFKLNKRWTVAV